MKAMPEFASLLQSFFLERLIAQKNASPRTVSSYRDTFKLLLRYVEEHLRKPCTAMELADFDAPLVLGFLEHLERDRGNSIRSRNARLAGLHSFAHYVALKRPTALHAVQQILAIPQKRYERPLLGFLSRSEIEALLNAPDMETWCGQRDRVLLAVLYNSGARVSEVTHIRVSDVTLHGIASVRLHGKGRKQRTVPLWKETARQIKRWIETQGLQPGDALLPTRQGHAMTRVNVSERLALAVSAATLQCPGLSQKRVSPHTLRHTTAMHLLQSGVDIATIALWLGHESPVTTHGYVEADLAMKERALAAVRAPSTKPIRFRAAPDLLSFLEGL